ncbi:S8 family serine peptidase [Oceanobacillus piezotolerans]|uniref:S8 family serine peptidase n=1 Tax=Oceanobacillus piezotolerans TaxID=2448030 RepID=UPI0011C48FF2|nr:S8 family serine peptidase [Oceanobacillus piezotolerans]
MSNIRRFLRIGGLLFVLCAVILAIQANFKSLYIDKKSPLTFQTNEKITETELDQTNEQDRWNIQTIGATLAWEKGFTGEGVNIAVVDTGIAPHPDLNITGGVSTVDYTEDWGDDNGHGTHVAGIIGAKRDDTGVVGVAPDANLYAVKAVNEEGKGQIDDVVEAIEWCMDNDMDIMNLSIGGDSEIPQIKDALDRAYKAGILIVSASGNNGEDGIVSFPARLESVIAVSAVDGRLNPTPFSTRGPEVEFTAPGMSIVSTYLNQSYGVADGTSQAAPHVTGMLAILKEKYPHKTNEELRNALTDYVMEMGESGRDNIYGHGFIYYQEPDRTPPDNITNLNVGEQTSNSIVLEWQNPQETDLAKTKIQVNGKIVDSLPKDISSYLLEDLRPDTEYTISLSTEDEAGNTSSGKTIIIRTDKAVSDFINHDGVAATSGVDNKASAETFKKIKKVEGISDEVIMNTETELETNQQVEKQLEEDEKETRLFSSIYQNIKLSYHSVLNWLLD